MGYDEQPRSSAWTVIAIVLPLVFVVVGGLFILALAAWFYLRLSQEERVAAVAHEQAAVQADELARVMAEEAEEAADVTRTQAGQVLKTAPAFEQGVVNKTVPDTQITVELDKAGKLKLDGEAIELAALLDRLKVFAADATTSITVDVRADEECQFRNVVALISTCQELGITRFRFGTLDATIAEKPSENKEPATVIE